MKSTISFYLADMRAWALLGKAAFLGVGRNGKNKFKPLLKLLPYNPRILATVFTFSSRLTLPLWWLQNKRIQKKDVKQAFSSEAKVVARALANPEATQNRSVFSYS